MLKPASIVLLTALTLAPLGSAEVVKEVDGSIKYFIKFTSKATDDAGRKGYAFVVLGKGVTPESMEIERAYGLVLVNDEPRFTKVRERIVTVTMHRNGKAETESLVVYVNKDQYQEAKDLIDSKSEAEGAAAEAAALELGAQMTEIAKIKQPYLSGLGSSTAMAYFKDVVKLN